MNNIYLSFKIAQKNFSKLNNYYKLIKDMHLNFNLIIKEYLNYTKIFIEKITELTNNFSKAISGYEKTLKLSHGTLQEMILLLRRVQSIFYMQSINFQVFIDGYKKEEKKSINEENFTNLELISNDLSLKDKTILEKLSDLENDSNALFNCYNSIENSLAYMVISKDEKSKKLAINEITNLPDYKNTIEKEETVKSSNEGIIKETNIYFKLYEKYINDSKILSDNIIGTLKSNINIFINLYTDYCKNTSKGMEHISKNIKENESKEKNFIKLPSLEKDFNTKKYQIKLISNKFLEDKNKKLNLKKYEKMGYQIKEDKLFLKDEEIYEIVKIMYAQFQYIDESIYNLIDEQIKINIKNLTEKLLSFGIKKSKINKEIKSINDGEINLLYKYIDNPFNRFEFLSILNNFRANGFYEVPEKEYEILKTIFLKSAEKIIIDKDIPSAKLLLILSQTFYCKKNGTKVYLHNYIKNHDLFKDVYIWEQYLINLIDEDLQRANRSNKKENSINEETKRTIINNILNAQLLPFCDNMIEFGMSVENIYKIINPIMNEYKIKDDLKNTLVEFINSRKNETK